MAAMFYGDLNKVIWQKSINSYLYNPEMIVSVAERDWEMRWLSPICNLSRCVLVVPELAMAHILDSQKY